LNTAYCYMDGTNGAGSVFGLIEIYQSDPESPAQIVGSLDGVLPDGKHGFHVHEFGELGNGCKDAGGHFNPMGVNHAAPDDEVRHFGDLGNVDAFGGRSSIDISDSYVTLEGEFSVIGKSIVIHEGEDDLGRGGDDGSLASGNAGARLGCCTIMQGSRRYGK